MASLPAGTPFPQWIRDRVLELHGQGLKSPAIADELAPLGPKERTVRDIIAAERDEQRQTAKPHTNGHTPPTGERRPPIGRSRLSIGRTVLIHIQNGQDCGDGRGLAAAPDPQQQHPLVHSHHPQHPWYQ